jgi:hypothetical protein
MASFDENEESDWNSSRIKGFTFGDDDDTPFEQLASYQSISENSLSQSGSGAQSPADELGVSFENNFSVGSGSSNQGSSRVVSDRVRAASAAYAADLDKRGIGSGNNQSISEVLSGNNDSSHQVVLGSASDPILLTNDVKTLRSELSLARKQLEKIQQARFVPLHPKETVRCIFLGQQYSLEFYKTWLDKLALIDAAIELCDGNAILAVALFLRQTLCRSKLAEALATRLQAVRQLVVYLEKRGLFNDLIDLYSSLGQYNEAALIQYKASLVQSGRGGINGKARRIKSALSTPYFSQCSDSCHLVEHINLLERTSPILAAVPSLQASSDQSQVSGAGTTNVSLIAPTLKDPITVYDLVVCCAYYYGSEVPENLLHSGQAMKKCHKLTERQFVWASLKGRATKNAWKDCEQLVLSKGWLGGRKIKPEFLPLDVAKLLHDYGAPADCLNVYIAMIEAPEDKEKFAKKIGAHTAVIDVYVSQRDKQALQNYKSKLVPKTEEWWYAENALNAGNTRWKN